MYSILYTVQFMMLPILWLPTVCSTALDSLSKSFTIRSRFFGFHAGTEYNIHNDIDNNNNNNNITIPNNNETTEYETVLEL